MAAGCIVEKINVEAYFRKDHNVVPACWVVGTQTDSSFSTGDSHDASIMEGR